MLLHSNSMASYTLFSIFMVLFYSPSRILDILFFFFLLFSSHPSPNPLLLPCSSPSFFLSFLLLLLFLFFVHIVSLFSFSFSDLSHSAPLSVSSIDELYVIVSTQYLSLSTNTPCLSDRYPSPFSVSSIYSAFPLLLLDLVSLLSVVTLARFLRCSSTLPLYHFSALLLCTP